MRLPLLIALLPFVASGANSITPSGMILRSTYGSISVVAPFTGDDNGNAVAAVQFRTGSDAYVNAYTPSIDRRPVVAGASNSNSNQARVAIAGLQSGLSYDVILTWTDVDGGGASYTNQISTQSRSWPVLSTNYVDAAAGSEGNGSSGSPWKTITNANVQAASGALILVAPGTYFGGTWTNSGASGWTTLKANGGTVTVSNMTLNATKARLNSLTFPTRNGDSLTISGGSQWVIDSCTFLDVSESGTYGDAGLSISGTSVSNGIVSGCSFTTDNTGNSVFGIYGEGEIVGALTIESNTFTGTFRDPISRSSQSLYDHGLVRANTVTGWNDDGIEFEGQCINSVLLGNIITDSPVAASCIGFAGPTIGPAYVARNFCRTTNSSSYVVKAGVDMPQSQAAYVFHNTFIAGTNAADAMSRVGGSNWVGLVSRNNVLIAYRYPIYRGRDGQDWDYDVLLTTDNTKVADEWNGSTSYLSVSAFNAGTGQEAHGVATNPGIRSDGSILSGSSAINAGVALSGWNGTGTAWPYSGGAPDIGAYEFNGSGGAVAVNVGTLVVP